MTGPRPFLGLTSRQQALNGVFGGFEKIVRIRNHRDSAAEQLISAMLPSSHNVADGATSYFVNWRVTNDILGARASAPLQTREAAMVEARAILEVCAEVWIEGSDGIRINADEIAQENWPRH